MAKGYSKMGMGMRQGGGMGSQQRHQIQELQKQLEEQQTKIAQTEVTATVGGGVLKITMTGDQVCKKVEIDPNFLRDSDQEMVQDMILTGINSAVEESKKIQEQNLSSLTSGLSGLGLGF